jgi:hypothetical protein
MKREGVSRGSTRVGQVSKPLPRVTTLLVHVSTSGPHIGVDIWQVGPTHATWHSPAGPHQQQPQIDMPHGSTWLSRVNMGSTHGTHLLVYISSELNLSWHMAAQHEATSAPQLATCQPPIGPHHPYGPHPGTSHLTGGPHHIATWQSSSGPSYPSLCHMTALYSATSAVLTGH